VFGHFLLPVGELLFVCEVGFAEDEDVEQGGAGGGEEIGLLVIGQAVQVPAAEEDSGAARKLDRGIGERRGCRRRRPCQWTTKRRSTPG
jgi:hypothetical protein